MTEHRTGPARDPPESNVCRPDTIDDVFAFVSTTDADVVLVRWVDDGTPRTVFGTEFTRLPTRTTPTESPAADVLAVDQSVARPIPVGEIEWLHPVKSRGETTRALPADAESRVRVLRGLAAEAPALVAVKELLAVLDSNAEHTTETVVVALEAVATLVAERSTACVVTIPHVQRLVSGASETAVRDAAVHCLAMFARASPTDVTPHVDTVFPLLEAATAPAPDDRAVTPVAVDAAVACVAHVANDGPTAVVDCVDALRDILASEAPKRRMHAAYTIGRIASVAPDAVRPAATQLAALAGDETEHDAIRLNATCAVGRIAGPWPDDVVPELATFVALLRSADTGSALRANAAGVVGDVASAHAIDVRRHTEALVGCLDDDGTTRANVSTALARVAREFPDSMTPYLDAFVDCLDDEESLVRENACWTLGYLREEAEPAQPKLEQLRLTDDEETVRARAAWALDEVDEGRGSGGVGV